MKGKKMTMKERLAKVEADKTERRKIFKELCSHVSKGYSMECFGSLSLSSIEKYLKLFKEEFVQEELEEAFAQGRQYWEDIGHRQANGNCLGNSRTWYYNMLNRYNWTDRVEVKAEHKGEVAINVVSYASTRKASDSVESK